MTFLLWHTLPFIIKDVLFVLHDFDREFGGRGEGLIVDNIEMAPHGISIIEEVCETKDGGVGCVSLDLARQGEIIFL